MPRSSTRKDEAQALQISQEHDRLVQSLSRLKNVSSADIVNNGFWFSYKDKDGNESVYYADLDALAAQHLTDAQLRELMTEIGSSTMMAKSTINDVPAQQLPPELQFSNELYQSSVGGTSSLTLEQTLRQQLRQATTSETLFELSYIDELDGNYAERDYLNRENCRLYRSRCDTQHNITLTGTVYDDQKNPIEGATVNIVSQPDVKAVTTDVHGAYAINLQANSMEKLRIRAYKRNYSDGYADTLVLTDSSKKIYAMQDISLEAPITIVTIDFAHKAVTGAGNTFNTDGSVTLRTSQSTYQIPKGAIVHSDGSPYTGGTVDVYLYEFTKGNPPTSLMQLDTFDQVIGYAGNLMKTFGMPYIQFFSPSGEELDVLKSDPMVLTYKIANMDDLRNNTDKIYVPLTDADMQTLINASASGQYPIDRSWLISHNMPQFPAFWVFDRKRGVWDNVGVSVLDTSGTMKSMFYTIRDNTP